MTDAQLRSLEERIINMLRELDEAGAVCVIAFADADSPNSRLPGVLTNLTDSGLQRMLLGAAVSVRMRKPEAVGETAASRGDWS